MEPGALSDADIASNAESQSAEIDTLKEILQKNIILVSSK